MLKTIRSKVVWTFAGLVILNLGAGFWSIYNFYALGSTVVTILHENHQSVVAAEKMMQALERQDNALLVQSEGEDPSSGGDFAENRQQFVYWQSESVRSLVQPVEERLPDSIQSAYMRYASVADSMLLRVQQGALREAKQYYYEAVRPKSDRLRDLCFNLFEINQAALFNAESRTHSIANQTAFGTLMTAVITLILSIIATAWLINGVVTPAEQLTETVKQIGRGQLDLKIDVLSDDEIGQLSREFNKMTERLKRFEQMNIDQILSEKRKSEAIVRSISDGLVATDASMAIVHINQVVAELFGLTDREAAGRPVTSLIRDERITSLIAAATRTTMESPERNPSVLQFQRGDRILYYRPKLTRIIDSEGALYGVLMLLQDVTQFKELDRQKSDFIATLSHEFRTPVTSINMSVDILNQGILGPLNVRQKELISSAREDCFRLSKLARELLQLSKLESGRVQLKNEELDVRILVDAILRPLQVQFNEKGVRLLSEIPPDLPKLTADEQQISWVITNLVTNALKYTREGGSVAVLAHCSENSLFLEVSDTGVGIAPEHLGAIFDKFVQVREGSGSTPGSVGLGLAIAKEIVEMYGGKIWATSTPGQGSIFSFQLPLTPVPLV
jgi:two-component system, NtrC family, sensor histidine kinase KinB